MPVDLYEFISIRSSALAEPRLKIVFAYLLPREESGEMKEV